MILIYIPIVAYVVDACQHLTYPQYIRETDCLPCSLLKPLDKVLIIYYNDNIDKNKRFILQYLTDG